MRDIADPWAGLEPVDAAPPRKVVVPIRPELGVDDYERIPDHEYQSEWGSGEQSATGKSKSSRAADIASRLVRLDQIEPVLSSLYLVKGWLDRGTASVVFGPSNVGKTFFALDLSMHIAAGLNWHGKRVPPKDAQPGPVVYVAGEGGFGIGNRVEAMRREHPDLMAGCEGRFLLLPTTLDLCTSHDAAHLVEALAAFDPAPALIVIDTLARAMGNGDENAAKDMGAFVASIDAIREATRAHVMVIHHSGKDTTKGARGWSGLRGAVDTEIELTREGDVITAESLKQRDGPSGATFTYQLRSVILGRDEDGDAVTSAVVEPTEAPVKRGPVIKGQALIAMQAFGDTLAAHGQVMAGDDFPANRQCVSVDHWRAMCDRHGLTDTGTPEARKKAFQRARSTLLDSGHVRQFDGYVWKVSADE